MKTTRVFATVCLLFSFAALIAATGVSVGDEPGIVRLTSAQPQDGNSSGGQAPVPDGVPNGEAGVATVQGSTSGGQLPPGQMNGPYPVPTDFAPYFDRSYGATQALPRQAYQPTQPFGPMLMYEATTNEGLGFEDGFHRFNARIPYHLIENTNVLMGDVSASVTNNGRGVFSAGGVYRNYDQSRNRVFGLNAFWDYDEAYGNGSFNRVTVGFESLGENLDFRANGYIVTGDDSHLVSDTLLTDAALSGNTVFKMRRQARENAWSGFDLETGGPLPVLGRYGMNFYPGFYWLDTEWQDDTAGLSLRFEALITESLTTNLTYTKDDHFGENAWVNIALTIPNYKGQSRVMRPRRVRERLQDPVIRSNRIHSSYDINMAPQALVRTETGSAWNILFVDPNATTTGTGTYESPFMTFQEAIAANNAGVDMIRLTPRSDDTGTNLTANGGITLFNNQILASAIKPYEIDPNCIIPAIDPPSGNTLGPLIQDPSILAGESVIRLANNNTVLGLRVDGSNAAGTVFGNGVSNPLPITDVNLTCNVFSNYVIGANLQDVSGRVIVDENDFTGRPGTSTNGLILTAAAGSTMELQVNNNSATNNSVAGISIHANAGSTINAADPNHLTAPTGITNNLVGVDRDGAIGANGDGISVTGDAGSTINALVENNTSSNNTANGFVGRTDGGTFNLFSMRNNTFGANGENGAFLHYLNGGTFNSVSEDLDGDGTLDPGEDLNGNGLLDEGIVSNTFSDNMIAGLCIFGEDASAGVFDIGGPVASLGNSFIGNTGAGLAVDLQDTATAQLDVVNNLMAADGLSNANPGLTFVLDFVEAGQSITDPFSGSGFTPFDVAGFGFAPSEFDMVTAEVLNTVRSHYYSIPTIGADARSPMPDGQQLDIDFVIGNLGEAPSNGATEYYTTVIGDVNPAPALGVAFLSAARDATGNPNPNFAVGDHISSIYSNAINGLGGLTPLDIQHPDEPPGVHYDIAMGDGTPALNDALTSGNILFTRNALAGTISHEVGHNVSLLHMDPTGFTSPTGAPPIMGTGATGLPNQARIGLREFTYDGTNQQAGGATQFHVQQLINAIGTRDAVTAGLSGDGIAINAFDSARLQSSTFINNTIERNNGDGMRIAMNNSAQAEGLTIQGNTIRTNNGRAIDLQATAAGAMIEASNTIGGAGLNTLGGTSYSQGNTITNNQGDGFRAFASNGGTINGNVISNIITGNGGNGVALQIENGGTVDFGTPASNRQITGNTLSNNGGAGVRLVSNVSATSQARMDAVIQGNTINQNVSGGIQANLNGPNHNPPAPPLVLENNLLNLTVGGTAATESNVLNGNGDVGVGVEVTGNGKVVADIRNNTITGTTNGSDPILNGDGINLRRADSSLLLATVEDNTATGNAGDGLDVDVQGNDKNDPNQPMTGTANTVDWNRNILSNNGENGARFRTRGDAYLIADGQGNVTNDNGSDGILINTSEASSFGDPTDGLPPGRRVRIDGHTSENNTQDGLHIVATEDSRALVEVTSTRVAGTSGAHAALNTNGDSSFSNNGRDGIRIETTGGRSDILITSGTGQTTISGNGTLGGGNGIRWDASGDSDAIVRVTRTEIRGNISGASEDTNNNGVLDAGEDLNNNDDIDVADGDGIQANFSNNTTSTLIVGNVGEGNLIQSNQDDGLAITATGSNATGNPRPIITVLENTIGGELDGVPAGNLGDGVSINVFGGTAVGIDPASVDFTLPILSPNNGVTESGAIPQITMDGNLISQNNRRGVNVRMTGASGTRNRENGNALFDPIRLTMNNNTVISNGEEGIFVRADADMNQSRFSYLANFPDPPFAGNDRTQAFAFYDPLLPQFQNRNLGSVNGNTAFLGNHNGNQSYLNLRTVQNSYLTITNNVIQNNGTNTVTGEGLFINVGTGAYVAADVQNNTFGGNLETDFRTASFLSAGETFTSLDTNGDQTFDVVYWDDTAQFDLRFQNNNGNQIAPSFLGDDTTPLGATYQTFDPLKAITMGTVGASQRNASLFQVENGANLDNPNNTFISFGITQPINGAFGTGGYNIRAAADPLFPNIGFAPYLP